MASIRTLMQSFDDKFFPCSEGKREFTKSKFKSFKDFWFNTERYADMVWCSQLSGVLDSSQLQKFVDYLIDELAIKSVEAKKLMRAIRQPSRNTNEVEYVHHLIHVYNDVDAEVSRKHAEVNAIRGLGVSKFLQRKFLLANSGIALRSLVRQYISPPDHGHHMNILGCCRLCGIVAIAHHLADTGELHTCFIYDVQSAFKPQALWLRDNIDLDFNAINRLILS